jgi:hypothetical protein
MTAFAKGLSEKLTLEKLQKIIPDSASRTMLDALGILSQSRMSQLDRAGEGPPSELHGRKVHYEKQAFISWYMDRRFGN